MRVALVDTDNTGFPNLALMKLSAAYKAQGHSVGWWAKDVIYDKILASSAFTFTVKKDLPDGAIVGGVGFKSQLNLPDSIEHICPDYELYPTNYSMGFLTRGCPRKCEWCVVPNKEGDIRPHAEFTEFVRHDTAVFLDNNVLAHDFGIDQIEKLGRAGVKVDFNQGLDARLIDDSVARRLGKLKWVVPLRMACDFDAMMPVIQKAATLLRWHNCSPRAYSCYVLVKDIESALERVKFLKGIGIDPFCQPYRDLASTTEPSREARRFSRWVNTKQLFRSMPWEEYKNWRGERI